MTVETPAVALAGLILAGGEGTRMGAPKAWVRLPDGRTLLDACAQVLRAAGARPIAATLPPGATGPLPARLLAVPLPAPGLDMFGSLRHGLARLLEEPWTVLAVLPVDHPLIRPETVTALAGAGPPAAVPTLAGRHGHPVCLGRTVAAAIVDGTLAGPTLREVLRAAAAVDVTVDDPGVRANCNTPEALARAWSAVAAPRPSG